jgi:hypothetical protein
MPGLELKSLRSFLAIKRCQGTKSKKVNKLARSSLIKVAHAPMGIPGTIEKTITIIFKTA